MGSNRRRITGIGLTAAICLLLLLLGGALSWFWKIGADYLWLAAAAIGLILSVSSLLRGLHQRRIGVDAIAVLALVGAVAIEEYFAAAVISVMLATGAMLEARAANRAVRDLSLLASRAPAFARILRGAEVERVPIKDVSPGDHLVLAAGDVVPVDGTLTSSGLFDESALTGEATPARHASGEPLASGIVCLEAGVTMSATGTAESSTYATIVALTRQAQAVSAPFVRLADRWAFAFIPATLAVAAAAWWLGGAERAVAVLVVATPCPLILAAPIALLSGIARCARQGAIVRNGWLPEDRLLHYDLHERLDVRHAHDFFAAVGTDLGPDDAYYVEQGLLQGAAVFLGLYDALWRNRSRRWFHDGRLPHLRG